MPLDGRNRAIKSGLKRGRGFFSKDFERVCGFLMRNKLHSQPMTFEIRSAEGGKLPLSGFHRSAPKRSLERNQVERRPCVCGDDGRLGDSLRRVCLRCRWRRDLRGTRLRLLRSECFKRREQSRVVVEELLRQGANTLIDSLFYSDFCRGDFKLLVDDKPGGELVVGSEIKATDGGRSDGASRGWILSLGRAANEREDDDKRDEAQVSIHGKELARGPSVQVAANTGRGQ